VPVTQGRGEEELVEGWVENDGLDRRARVVRWHACVVRQGKWAVAIAALASDDGPVGEGGNKEVEPSFVVVAAGKVEPRAVGRTGRGGYGDPTEDVFGYDDRPGHAGPPCGGTPARGVVQARPPPAGTIKARISAHVKPPPLPSGAIIEAGSGARVAPS